MTHRVTEESRPCDGRGRDWSYVTVNQGKPRIARSHQKLGERHAVDSPSVSRRNQTSRYLDIGLLDSLTSSPNKPLFWDILFTISNKNSFLIPLGHDENSSSASEIA